MRVPPVYLDECVDHALAAALRARSFLVTAAVDAGLTEVDDEAQLAYASAKGWLLLSHNERHFRRLHYAFLARGQPHGGIVLVTQRPPLELLAIRSALLLDWIGMLESCQSRLFKWGQLQQLLEEGFRPPGYGEAEIAFALRRP